MAEHRLGLLSLGQLARMPPILSWDVEVYISQGNARSVTFGAIKCMNKGSRAKKSFDSKIIALECSVDMIYIQMAS